MVHLLPFFIVFRRFKEKIKIRGLRPPTAPYSFAGQKE